MINRAGCLAGGWVRASGGCLTACSGNPEWAGGTAGRPLASAFFFTVEGGSFITRTRTICLNSNRLRRIKFDDKESSFRLCMSAGYTSIAHSGPVQIKPAWRAEVEGRPALTQAAASPTCGHFWEPSATYVELALNLAPKGQQNHQSPLP